MDGKGIIVDSVGIGAVECPQILTFTQIHIKPPYICYEPTSGTSL